MKAGDKPIDNDVVGASRRVIQRAEGLRMPPVGVASTQIACAIARVRASGWPRCPLPGSRVVRRSPAAAARRPFGIRIERFPDHAGLDRLSHQG